MRKRTTLAGAALLALLATVSSLAAQGGDPAGEWEGLIESPRRPYRIVVELHQMNGGWDGRIEFFGQEIPLERVRFQPPQVHFEFALADGTVVCDGKFENEKIAGTASLGEQTAPFSLERPLVFPAPKNRVEAWEQDLEVMVRKFLRYDRSFSPEERERLRGEIAGLKESLAGLNDQRIIVRLSRAMALADNAHTRLYLLRNRQELRRYPIRVWWFREGLYVVKAKPVHRDTLGARVVSIAGHDPQHVKQKVGELFAGNDSWVDYKSVYFMTSPEILYGLGLIPDMEAAEWSFEDASGTTFSRTLEPLPLERKQRATEAWWNLSPAHREESDWVHVLEGKQPLPLYLQNPDQRYWFEYLEESGTLYFQYNRSGDMPDGERFAEFGERLLAFLDRRPVEKLVVDLRFNTGGNLDIARPFWKKLAARKEMKQEGKLFVLVGRTTFSAGISAAAQLKESAEALLAGEPVGDRLDYWSEGGNILLPNSRLTLHYTSGFHAYSTIDYPEFQPYYLDMNVSDVEPDFVIRMPWEEYSRGRDPLLEFVLSYGDE